MALFRWPVACFLLAYIEGVSAARTLASKHGYEIDPRQELLALGAANLAAAFGQGFPVTGGLSQSAVNDKAGARTPLALVFASATLALCLLLLTGLLRNLPNVVLAAIVLVAVRGIDRHQCAAASLACEPFRVQDCHGSAGRRAPVGYPQRRAAGRCGVDPDVVGRVSRPHVAFLGRIPGTQRFSDLARHPDNEVVPGVVIVRVEAPLVYFNAGYVRDSGASQGPLRGHARAAGRVGSFHLALCRRGRRAHAGGSGRGLGQTGYTAQTG